MTTPEQPINDGGPADYLMTNVKSYAMPVPDMTLRQWYAGMALQGLLANAALLESDLNKQGWGMNEHIFNCRDQAELAATIMLAQNQST